MGVPLNIGVPENVGLPENVALPAIVPPKLLEDPLTVRSDRLLAAEVEVIPAVEVIVDASSAPVLTGANEIPASEKLTDVVGFVVNPVNIFNNSGVYYYIFL